MAEIIQLSNVRLSFPNLVEAKLPKGVPNGSAKFNADFILTPDHPDYARFMQAVKGVAMEKWKEQAMARLNAMQGERRMRCFGDGSEKVNQTTLKVYDGYEGMKYISASANADSAPVMVRANGSVCDNGNTMERSTLARKLYGGCFVNVAVRPWAQDNQFGKAVRCELVALQFFKDGTPFGEETNVEGMFKAVAPDAAPAAAPAATGFSWA